MSVKQNLDRKRKSKYRKILTLKNVLGLGAGFGLRAGYWKGWEINGLCSGFGARESGQGLGWAWWWLGKMMRRIRSTRVCFGFPMSGLDLKIANNR